jgi:beta-glucosidase
MVGRTYRYMTAEPLYPFGFGLSYSSFEYADLKLDGDEITAGDELIVSITVTNTGDRTASEVAQFYLSDLQASTLVPLHKLVGFERVTLELGESRTLKLTIAPDMMSFFDDDGKLTLEPGEFRLEVGGCSPGQRGQELGAPKPVTATFVVK